ncbi:MAG: hypothetical protein CVU61_13475 [Deltaproteobacteria bacterium HGW-Deltaproteobacteria-19]|jgi:hypothetical protein|nr:MAG: hypothetical protein CVU61_13475 [Deltaproteobacteria bacterium HGW-Deltaproteobacteria-19]
MTISTYQIDSVIKAYTKQYRERIRMGQSEEPARDQSADVVDLSRGNELKEGAFEKISYSLMDVLVGKRNQP